MEKIKIIQRGNNILKKIAREVSVENIKSGEIQAVIKSLKQAVLENEEAVAIAAPQIGKSLRIFVISEYIFSFGNKEKKKDDYGFMVFINPKILKKSREQKVMAEGCLSIAGTYGAVKRSGKIKVEACDENGKKFIKSGRGLFSQVIQHEIDHLDGSLFSDKALSLEKISNEQKIKIALWGAPEFSVKILEALRQNNLTPALIITSPDKPVGRKMILTPPAAKQWAEKNNILVWQPEKIDSNFILKFSEFKPELCIVASYGKILPKEILDIPKYKFINVHPSLLPKFRGPSPIQSAILSGEKETGVTIMLMNEKMDEGGILAMSNINPPAGGQISKLNYKELEEKLAELGGKLLVETIPKWVNRKIKPQEQDHSQATYTKKIKKEDGLINLDEPAELIERKIRAFTPWPSAYIFINDRRLIITQAEIKETGLKIKRVKPEGKNEMDFSDYLRGNPNPAIEKYLR